MRQSDDPFSIMTDIHSGEMITSSYTPTLEQRMEILQKKGKSSSEWDLSTKKDVATRCVDLKKEIVADLKSLDSTGNMDIHNKMNGIFQKWNSKNKISYENHSRLLSELIYIVYLIDDHINSNEAPAHNTHRGTQMREANLSPKRETLL